MKKIFIKKAQEFSPFFFIVIAIFCFSALTLLYNKYNSFSDSLGLNTFKIMQIYENSEKFYFYVNDLIKRSFLENLNNQLENSFSDCEQEYYGYKIINNNCKIDLNNIKKIDQEKIKKDFEKINQPFPNFDFYFLKNKDNELFSIVAKQKNKLVSEINPITNGKCCSLSNGYFINYFLTEKECSELSKYYGFDNSYYYKEVEKENCISDSELSLKYEKDILNLEPEKNNEINNNNNNVVSINNQNKQDDRKTQDIDEKNICSYCGTNRNLVKNYFGDNYPECNSNICCNAPCPPGTKKLNFPFYAQCDFSGFNFAACYAGCGPTSLKMALDGFHKTNYDLFEIWKNIGSIRTYTLTTRISNYANKLNNINAYCTSDISFESIKKYIDTGKTIIVLVHMPQYNKETARTLSRAWHFFLVVGYSNNEIIVHEPYPSPAAYSSLRKYGKYLVITRNTYQNNIYPSSLSYGGNCAGNIIYKEI
ncbi:MAG: C39 family peptidase [Candidatus Woesearchaeota archaeon]